MRLIRVFCELLPEMLTLSELHEEIARCTRCELAKYRTRAVPGEGSENAEIMFIGEAPGYYEALSGRPFCGAAGKVLDELLDFVGIKRKDIYITNVVKVRPPNNRDPKPEEIKAFGTDLNIPESCNEVSTRLNQFLSVNRLLLCLFLFLLAGYT